MNALTIASTSIRQFDGLYSLNDLHKAAGGETKHQPAQFVRLEQTKALVAEIECYADSHITNKALKTIRGNRKDGIAQGSYACKEIVYAYAMWISPKFTLEVIRTFDALQKGAALQSAFATTEQKQHVKSLVNKRAFDTGADYRSVWHIVFEECKFNKLENLTPAAYERVLQFFSQGAVKTMSEPSPQLLLAQHSRWLLSRDPDNNPLYQPIPNNAYVITQEEIVKAIKDPAYMFSRSLLPKVLEAVASRMS